MRVLVTGATRNAGTAVIRGLAKRGYSVIGADDRKLPFNAHSRYTRSYSFYPSEYRESFIDAIIELIVKEKIDVLLPVAGSKQISMHKSTIEKFTQVLLPGYESYMAAFDNQTTMQECQRLNIDCPALWQEKDALRVLKQNKTSRYPISFVLKPIDDIGGARGFGIFNDEATLRTLQRKASRYGNTCIQEYIPGGVENMRTVNLLFDKSGELVTTFATKKIRQWPNTGGISALSISIHAPELVDFVMPFFRSRKWEGIAEVEIKIDARNQQPKLIEINPRFCGYIGFAIDCGADFPHFMCRLAQGNPASAPQYLSGIKYINWFSYFKAALSELMGSRDKTALMIKLFSEIKGRKKASNMDWADFKLIAAKIAFELINKE
jgi:D-aspartate ligase